MRWQNLNEDTKSQAILRVLRHPEAITEFSDLDWADFFVRVRTAGLLARIAALLEERELLDRVPEKARLQLDEVHTFLKRNQTDLRFEANRVTRALENLAIPIVLLKGGAYLLADLPPADRRMVSDLDIMVEKRNLDAVERELREAGWRMEDVTEYDERYYRRWMHEIPPMWHPDRLFAVDLHHTIVPLTSRQQPDADALFEAAVSLENERLKVLCPADMVLHSAVHLFNEEIGLGLRDLLDLHDLLTHFGKDQAFWDDLANRAHLHGLNRTLFYLLRYNRRLLGTEIPKRTLEAARKGGPNPVLRVLMDALFISALTPARLGVAQPGRALALWLLYVRSHWLKMPPLLLVKHLLTKALQRRRERIGRSAPPRPEAEAQ